MLNKSQVTHWLAELVDRLQEVFGSRLLLVVHVGSWARDDANAQSDIDVNVILDRVTPEDIATYRAIISGMPDRQLACGYLGGLNEIRAWPRYDLTAFYYGSEVLYGDMHDVIGPITSEDVFNNAMVTLSTINHAVRHAMIYDKDITTSAHAAKDLFKAAFFVIQVWHWLTSGEYVAKRRGLAEETPFPEDRLILHSYEHWDEDVAQREEQPLDTLALLERWSSGMFDRLAGIRKPLSSRI